MFCGFIKEFIVYLPYWGLTLPPFENAVDLRFFYESAYHSEALMRLTYTVAAHKGAAALVGDVGCGKTLICKAYTERLPRDKYEVRFIPQLPSSTEEETLQEMLFTFGEETTAGLSKSAMLRIFNDKLINIAKNGKHTIIVIDEAHLMKTPSMEMVRLFLNYQYNNGFLCTIILAGQPELKENIRKMPQLEQRISINYHLKPLNAEGMEAYIKFRMIKAGSTKQIFKADAYSKILQYTSGVPRKVNNICDMSLLFGYSSKKEEIDAEIVDRVAEEMTNRA